jgi:hypothetical protein
VRPLAHPVLYPRHSLCKAIPKYISGRTSYFRLCLAFHPYPQLIRAFFNIQRFGPPRDFTHASPWPWIDQPVSGLLHTTYRHIKTRFRYGFTSRLNLAAQNNSLTHYAKGTRSLRTVRRSVHKAPAACRQTVSGTISLSSTEYFSPFPHGTGSLSVIREYLALEDGPPSFTRNSTCSALLG